MAQNVLNPPTENPEEPHVPQDVQPSAVDEHGGQHGRSMQAIRHNSIGGDKAIELIATKAQLVEENQHIRNDQQQGNGRRRIVALGGSQRNHSPMPLAVLLVITMRSPFST